MSITNQPQPAEDRSHIDIDVVSTNLSKSEIEQLTGFFDVLVQMDLAHRKQLNEKGSEGEKSTKTDEDDTSKTH